jgi:phosphoglucosamine mutase
MGKLFGTDGVRGEAGVFPLDESTVQAIGASVARQFAERLGRTPRFITGRDTRESGGWIEREFYSGLTNAGGFGESAGVITTPGVAYLTGRFGFDAGIVISASHNPYQDNGIKIFLPDGKKIDEAVESRIEDDVADAGQEAADTANEEVSSNTTYQATYLEHLASEFPDLDLKGFKLIADCANGAATDLAPQLFERFGAEVTAINDRPNGRNINENSGSLHLEGLQEKVLESAADFGVAFDGDADRALFVDEKGNVLDGDMVLWILGKYLLDHGKLKDRTIVATVMSNVGLEIALASKNIKLTRTAVGDKYVLDELLKSGSAIGGEQSGHIIIPQKSLVGDGMMTSLFLLQAVRESGKCVSELTAGFVKYPQVLVNVKVREKQPFENVNEIAVEARRIEEELNGSGRLLLRYSGTENLARVMIEGKDQEIITEQADRLAEVIRTQLG